ncbi:thiamine pyrophosphate-dependent dehydrogenase E1 component subunit alpha [Micromonospora sp. LOL_015]|uniref:thiamine pyrophosphate-dependent dehydrogenase E1 component subunit alpha n=1 Tax=Micromonospora sp. LOL_015 TaxID=3345416 RepID=UPI003A895570
MRLIREFEEHCLEMALTGTIVGGIHPYIGQEAVAVGVSAHLRPDDVVTSTHRGHGHVLAKGADPKRAMAELYGASTGLNRGRGGSMHAADMGLGIYGANGIVGAGAPIAVGAAWAARRQGRDQQVAVAFFGDGALSQGVVLEAFNMAVLWSLPVLFVCENNGYATSLPIGRGLAGDPVRLAAGFGLTVAAVDGMDVEAVSAAAGRAVAACRAGGGPHFLECATYRFHGHHTVEHLMGIDYRDPTEVADWKARDPLIRQRARLAPAVAAEVDAEITALIAEAAAFAGTSPGSDPGDALDYLYAGTTPTRPGA